ncbi:hypothetical protein HPT27_01110 [Permianibacter sp. IMCC34836]|uniref:hypothetical protein n=1 Tax=Permianibacter fluminis TaxID=2738515 RepID=UPI00155556DA|nr:hypothetical protein [Permianibacter fluminis]NQD35600.1 hypothetical protein [Permianibacter fluminis]
MTMFRKLGKSFLIVEFLAISLLPFSVEAESKLGLANDTFKNTPLALLDLTCDHKESLSLVDEVGWNIFLVLEDCVSPILSRALVDAYAAAYSDKVTAGKVDLAAIFECELQSKDGLLHRFFAANREIYFELVSKQYGASELKRYDESYWRDTDYYIQQFIAQGLYARLAKEFKLVNIGDGDDQKSALYISLEHAGYTTPESKARWVVMSYAAKVANLPFPLAFE